MAEIVQSLFGVTPEMYQQSQQARADQQALQYAQLSPFQQANYAIGRGANMLGGAIGRGLGGEDPELARITARQQISKQINYADPKSIAQGVQLLSQAGDTQGAMYLADVGRKAESEMALAQQRQRERAAADPFQKLVVSGKYTTPSLAAYQRSGLVEDLDLYVKPEKPENLRFGEKREAVSNEMFDNKAFKDLTPKEKAIVNKRLEDEEGTKAEKGAPKTYLPGQPIGVKDWQSFTLDVLGKNPTMQRTSTVISDAPLALEVIRTSSDNDISAAALPGVLSRLVGKDSSISNLDIKTYASTGGLDDRLAESAVKFFTGRSTDVKKDQALKFTTALYRGALLSRKKQLQNSADEFGYLDSPNYKKALKNIDDELSQFTAVKKGEVAPIKTGNPLVDKWLSTDAEKK
jgi:hypothetical protein